MSAGDCVKREKVLALLEAKIKGQYKYDASINKLTLNAGNLRPHSVVLEECVLAKFVTKIAALTGITAHSFWH